MQGYPSEAIVGVEGRQGKGLVRRLEWILDKDSL
jgi:hypothetical protein